jgi:hypothetical protein
MFISYLIVELFDEASSEKKSQMHLTLFCYESQALIEEKKTQDSDNVFPGWAKLLLSRNKELRRFMVSARREPLSP